MIRLLLVAVDDSPAALAAARLSAEIAAATGATVHAVAVISAPLPTRPAGARAETHGAVGAGRANAGTGRVSLPNADLRQKETAAAVLRYVSQLGKRCGVAVETSLLAGEPAPCVLDLARAIGADLIVVGLSRQRGPGQPYIGSQTRHILEFAESPVVVVPAS